MEFVESSSTPPDHHHYGPPPPNRRRFSPGTQPFSDRVIRAVSHRLHLLHRAHSLFFVLGATGNVYTVSISHSPSCTCPDRIAPCKHILFVFIRVLSIPPDDPCLWRPTLLPRQRNRLLALPTSGEALASASVRERFHYMLSRPRPRRTEVSGGSSGGACPICLDNMGREDRVVACVTCKNVIHEVCFLAWKRNCRRGSVTCVLCRARWRNAGDDQEKYLNLSAYVDEEDVVVEGDVGRCT